MPPIRYLLSEEFFWDRTRVTMQPEFAEGLNAALEAGVAKKFDRIDIRTTGPDGRVRIRGFYNHMRITGPILPHENGQRTEGMNVLLRNLNAINLLKITTDAAGYNLPPLYASAYTMDNPLANFIGIGDGKYSPNLLIMPTPRTCISLLQLVLEAGDLDLLSKLIRLGASPNVLATVPRYIPIEFHDTLSDTMTRMLSGTDTHLWLQANILGVGRFRSEHVIISRVINLLNDKLHGPIITLAILKWLGNAEIDQLVSGTAPAIGAVGSTRTLINIHVNAAIARRRFESVDPHYHKAVGVMTKINVANLMINAALDFKDLGQKINNGNYQSNDLIMPLFGALALLYSAYKGKYLLPAVIIYCTLHNAKQLYDAGHYEETAHILLKPASTVASLMLTNALAKAATKLFTPDDIIAREEIGTYADGLGSTIFTVLGTINTFERCCNELWGDAHYGNTNNSVSESRIEVSVEYKEVSPEVAGSVHGAEL